MAAFIPGTGGDLKSVTIEAAFVELAQLLQAEELANTEVDAESFVTLSYDSEAGTASITANMPITIAVDATGKAVVTVTPYIP